MFQTNMQIWNTNLFFSVFLLSDYYFKNIPTFALYSRRVSVLTVLFIFFFVDCTFLTNKRVEHKACNDGMFTYQPDWGNLLWGYLASINWGDKSSLPRKNVYLFQKNNSWPRSARQRRCYFIGQFLEYQYQFYKL